MKAMLEELNTNYKLFAGKTYSDKRENVCFSQKGKYIKSLILVYYKCLIDYGN